MNLNFSSPTITDIDTLYRWGENNWELWGDDKYKWYSKESLHRWITDPKEDVLLVAKDGSKLIGMCMMLHLRDWAFCAGLFVDKKYRRKGIGKKLVDEAGKRLKQKGVDNVILLVDVKNKEAEKFYTREGFYKGFQFHMMTKEL